jgi:hypothetical protein
MSKNDTAWEELFKIHNILDIIDENGFYEITANDINVQREARLMTKFDHKIQLPKIFKDNDLTIQPNSRGTYILGRFASYQDIPAASSLPEIEIVSFPSGIETISPENIFSESMALLCAYNSNMIDDLLEEETVLTVLGRMSTGCFSYFINSIDNITKHNIVVANSQCEIDGGFEGNKKVALIEVKNTEVSDFIIRQLYYPYRLWKPRTTKEVVPILLSYSDNIFSFYVYRFLDEYHYNSMELVSHKKYQIGVMGIELCDIIEVLNTTIILSELQDIPFPQSDSFNRLLDLLTHLYIAQSPVLQENITNRYAFDIRQTQYYTNAGAYLGLIEKKNREGQGVRYSLTETGIKIMAKKLRARNLALIRLIFEHAVFNKAFRCFTQQGVKPTREQIEIIMRETNLKGLSENNSTVKRRTQTVLAWIDWILSLTLR